MSNILKHKNKMKKILNEEFKRMQLLAGLITESQTELEEVDSSLLGGIAKNLYLYLSKMKPNNPVDINGSTLKNVKGDDITHDRKVAADYQNPSVGMDKFVKQGKAKRLGGKEIGGNEVSLSYFGNQILALGFVKKEEAQKALDEVLKKYSKQVTGEIQTDKMSYDWAKHYAPTYTLKITMKGDKELAKSQSINPSSAKSPTPTAESINIEQSVNEALRKYRNKK